MKKTAVYSLNDNPIEKITTFVQETLKEFRVQSKERVRGTLIAEEAAGSLVANADEKGEVKVSVKMALGEIMIEMSCPGREYELEDNIASASMPTLEDVGDDVQRNLQNIILRSLADELRYRYLDGRNNIRILLVHSRKLTLLMTLTAVFAAVILGAVLSLFAPDALIQGVDKYFLTPANTFYMNALEMAAAPAVFFSIVSCFASIADLSDLGKIGGKTLLLYALTTILAVGVGIGAFYLIKPGYAGLAATVQTTAVAEISEKLSIRDLIMDMMPSNFIAPFLNNNMRQLILLSVICGIANGMIGKYSIVLKALFDACNELFTKIASLVLRFLPIAVFCSTASMVMSMGPRALVSVLAILVTFILGLCFMLAVYVFMIISLGRLDPRPFIRKYYPVTLQVFSLASSSSAIPMNIDVCEKKLGVNRAISNLSIPLGATLNLDGTCIQLAVFALAIAKVYGVPVSPGSLLAMGITIIVLSIGAPAIPGEDVICLSVLLQQLWVPADAVALVMGIGPLVGMFLTASNCVGDMVITMIIARMSGEMNIETYMK